MKQAISKTIWNYILEKILPAIWKYVFAAGATILAGLAGYVHRQYLIATYPIPGYGILAAGALLCIAWGTLAYLFIKRKKSQPYHKYTRDIFMNAIWEWRWISDEPHIDKLLCPKCFFEMDFSHEGAFCLKCMHIAKIGDCTSQLGVVFDIIRKYIMQNVRTEEYKKRPKICMTEQKKQDRRNSDV